MLVINLIKSRITKATDLPVGEYVDCVHQCGRLILTVGSTIASAENSVLRRERELSTSRLAFVPLHVLTAVMWPVTSSSCTLTSPPWWTESWTRSQNKPFTPYIAFVTVTGKETGIICLCSLPRSLLLHSYFIIFLDVQKVISSPRAKGEIQTLVLDQPIVSFPWFSSCGLRERSIFNSHQGFPSFFPPSVPPPLFLLIQSLMYPRLVSYTLCSILNFWSSCLCSLEYWIGRWMPPPCLGLFSAGDKCWTNWVLSPALLLWHF